MFVRAFPLYACFLQFLIVSIWFSLSHCLYIQSCRLRYNSISTYGNVTHQKIINVWHNKSALNAIFYNIFHCDFLFFFCVFSTCFRFLLSRRKKTTNNVVHLVLCRCILLQRVCLPKRSFTTQPRQATTISVLLGYDISSHYFSIGIIATT